tara:strand:- start:2295 stop:2654 length:360 start_codon:yes stop_codon:yes gene_type:complete
MAETKQCIKVETKSSGARSERKTKKPKYDRRAMNDCPCGGKYQNKNKGAHMTSKRHKYFLENNEVLPKKCKSYFTLPLSLLTDEQKKIKKAYYKEYSKNHYQKKKAEAEKLFKNKNILV